MKRRFFGAFLASAGLVVVLATARVAAAAGSITKGPWMQHVTPTSAVVLVEVDPPAPVTIELGLSSAVGSTDAGAGSVIESRDVRALHSILVKGLEPATRYAFTVRVGATTRYGALTTAPREETGEPFRFLVYGDTRSDDAAHAAVVVAMVGRASSFLVNTGDFVERGNSRSEWQSFFDIEAPLMRERPLFSCVGNHELTEGAGLDYVRYFGPAELPKEAVAPAPAVTGVPLHDAGSPAKLTLDQLSGTFRWSNARFFMVNGMVPLTSGPTRAWLDRVLTDSDNEPGLVWRIVVVHHGPWSSGPHGDNKLLQEANIPQLLSAHKVDLVISGHDHIYERGWSDGIAYIVSGGGGSPVYRVKKAEKTSRRYESVHHFVEAFVSPVAIQFVAMRPDGSTVESCALAKGVGWTCDGSDGGGAADSARPPASPSRCGCRMAGGDGEPSGRNAALLFVAALAAGSALLTRRARRRSVR